MSDWRVDLPFIDCSDLFKAGYPENYTAIQQALLHAGWVYSVGTDRWYNPRTKKRAAGFVDGGEWS